MSSLRGKVVLITGASSGFGAATAELFAREGCPVVLAARRMDRLEQVADRIRSAGGEALPVAVDVTQPRQIDDMVKAGLDANGRIDILFNNAGFGRLDWLEALDPVSDIRHQIDVNLLGMILTARAVLPCMYAQRSGHIINMSSVAGWIAPPLYSIYSAAKFGIRGFSEALRREAAPFGVKVSAIYPSSADTEFGLHVGPSAAKQRLRMPPWLRLSAEDVARSVVSLAKHPRPALIVPWWMAVTAFLSTHFSAISDSIQASASKKYHHV